MLIGSVEVTKEYYEKLNCIIEPIEWYFLNKKILKRNVKIIIIRRNLRKRI